MTALAENTLTPFEIQDARAAVRMATEQQRGVETAIKNASKDLAEKERQYRLKLTTVMLELHAQDGVAWTACDALARGKKEVADLRYARDVAKGVLEAAQQQAYTFAADRRDLHRLIEWSQRRDIHGEPEPLHWPTPEGAGLPPGVNPQTGELKAA